MVMVGFVSKCLSEEAQLCMRHVKNSGDASRVSMDAWECDHGWGFVL